MNLVLQYAVCFCLGFRNYAEDIKSNLFRSLGHIGRFNNLYNLWHTAMRMTMAGNPMMPMLMVVRPIIMAVVVPLNERTIGPTITHTNFSVKKSHIVIVSIIISIKHNIKVACIQA